MSTDVLLQWLVRLLVLLAIGLRARTLALSDGTALVASEADALRGVLAALHCDADCAPVYVNANNTCTNGFFVECAAGSVVKL